MLMPTTSTGDLFDPKSAQGQAVVPWKPEPLTHEQWPPDYVGVYAWRMKTLDRLRREPRFRAGAEAYYAKHPAEFIMHWMDTYDPRKATGKWMPFVFFERQYEFISFLEDLRHSRQNGLVEKCRDMGATWLACGYSVWALRFVPGDSTGWGSRKQDLVDKLGDPDSIFEKMRLMIERLPDVWRPDVRSGLMKLINDANGASTTGESGDGIGRGGRKSRYFVDEASHIERPELIEASLGDNTDVRVDISSVNGLGNPFHRRREAGELWVSGHEIPHGTTRVFVFDWRHHPEKTQEWYDNRKARAVREGMQHVFAQEVDRNYSAAVDNTIIALEWVQAAVDAHLHIPCLRIPPEDNWFAGLDIADEGGDLNALSARQGIILRRADEWGDIDPGATTRRTVRTLREWNMSDVDIQYDCIGMGATVKSEYNRLVQEGLVDPGDLRMVPWHAGGKVVEPYARVVPDDSQSALNRDFFHNMRAQAWWSIRTRFYKTWRAREHGETYRPDELISIDSDIPLLHQVMKELAQPTRGESSATLKMVVNKKPSGSKSPNLADSIVQCYFPIPDRGVHAETGSYGG